MRKNEPKSFLEILPGIIISLILLSILIGTDILIFKERNKFDREEKEKTNFVCDYEHPLGGFASNIYKCYFIEPK